MSTPPPPFGAGQSRRPDFPFAAHDPMRRAPAGLKRGVPYLWLIFWPAASLATAFLANYLVTVLYPIGGVSDAAALDSRFRSYYGLYMAGEIGFLWLFARWLSNHGLLAAIFEFRPKRFAVETGFGLVLFAVSFVFAIAAVDAILPVLPVQTEAPRSPYAAGGLIGVILATMTIVIFAPLVEELVMRGWLLPMLVARMGGWVLPLILSSLAFGLLHFSVSVQTVIYTTVLGFCAGLARRMTGRLWAPIVLHFANNVVAALPL
jgi:membrane protease YdiL (CAAX protease family)